ncbi:Putative zinc ribbon domain protein [Corynebacterium heidelbergense]|nr:Putative zinc ribbon domain protein [Corynebacterium heidelbergense]
MHCTPEQRRALATLASSSEQLTILSARIVELPERKEYESAKQDIIESRNEAARNRAEQRQEKQDLERMRQDVAKLAERKKADVKALSAEIDREKRRELKYDLAAAETRLEELQSRLQHMEHTHNLFHEPVEVEEHEDLSEASEKLARAESALRADITAAEARVASAREQLPQEILEAYDAQEREHGVGAAPLHGRTCQGCFMELDTASMKMVRHTTINEIPRCPECGVFLLVDAT